MLFIVLILACFLQSPPIKGLSLMSLIPWWFQGGKRKPSPKVFMRKRFWKISGLGTKCVEVSLKMIVQERGEMMCKASGVRCGEDVCLRR
jgi:hypothetical protein